ncbi:MAG: MotA/TolQ/ExbB proton channel family protein [Sulfurimonas sp.]|jgi:methyl-accepting chemotaxis protein|uniref:MotA/TolQ/ExbB proton channel family protein n=1 Tax=Sulfurimonas sp. TaxID=2022749 RepID=UPI002636580F|nr:MotA/TolQ/ExbB proton channel family protein [Sulfurimonas sp.]MDD3476494.1 MotA/TolQ/ExbB proton channel family protein [Sulfurimonas sp.]HUH42725.1 MotA/TolQ/ExbB proton channel family protein [Sulfurimonas sp.]
MRRLKILKVYAILWLFIFFIVFYNYETLYGFFLSTITFNVAVMTVLAIGLMVIVKASIDLVMLTGTFAVIRYKKDATLDFYLSGIDKIFPENVAKMFTKRASHHYVYFTHTEAHDVSDWLQEKFINQKSYINFFVSMCLMIGLLGTFTGLLSALNEMGAIVLSLKGDVNIGEIMMRLNDPIVGMAVGFGSSLFGVAAAIILSIKGYVLEKNQANFIEDVQDWINSLIIEGTLTSEDGVVSGGSSMSKMMDIFTEKMSDFSQNMSLSNKSNEAMLKILSQSMDGESKSAREMMAALDKIANGTKDLNINQYQSSNALIESIQDLSSATMNSNRNLKSILELQEKNNQILEELLKGSRLK